MKVGYLKEFVMDSGNWNAGHGAQQKGNPLPSPLGVIKVIYATLRGVIITRKGVLIVAPKENCSEKRPPEKRIKVDRLPISFDEEDLKGTIQPLLVVTMRISDFLVKRVMIDQGSGDDEMYPNLFEGLGLKNQDLMRYDMPLVSFDGRVVIPKGQISLPVNMEGKKVMVTFIVVRSFSPYTSILGRPWIHAMRAVPSTLHEKVKFPIEQGVAVVRGNQQVARQCLAAVVSWKGKQAEQKETAEEASS